PIQQDRLQLPGYLSGPRRDVKTPRAAFEISKSFGRPFWVAEKFQIDFGHLHRRFGNDPLKNWTDCSHSRVERCREVLSGRKAKTACKATQWFRLFWNSVGLLFGLDLQTMLDAAQKSIRAIKCQDFLVREKIQFTQRTQRLEHARFLEERMPGSIDELQCLHNEFDFANAADAKLDVAVKLLLSHYIAFDAALNVSDLLEQIGRRTLRINKRLMLPQEFICQLAAAGDASPLDEREALPCFAETGIIIFHALERPRQRACRPFRAQPQIDSKK